MKIVIADDEPIARLRLQKKLTEWGYQVFAASNGLQAWAMLQGPAAPRLAILDWIMPELDGTGICRRLRQTKRDEYVYTLLLSGKEERGALIEGLDSGADDYLTKPFDDHELRARLRVGERIVRLHEQLVMERQRAEYQSMHDALLGCMTRGAIRDAALRELARVAREALPLSLVIADIDHFKLINDTFGHPAGDAVLREAVERLRTQLRPYDLIGRYGGEEFMLLLPEADLDGGLAAAERLRAAVAGTPFFVGERQVQVPVTCSFGVATTEGTAALDDLVERADRALYRAKQSGRNRVEHAGRLGQARPQRQHG